MKNKGTYLTASITPSRSSMVMLTAISNSSEMPIIKYKNKSINTWRIREWYFSWRFPFLHARYITLGFIKGKAKEWETLSKT